MTSLLFLLPWIGIYEAGILMLSRQEGSSGLRNGADYWLRSLLGLFGTSQILVLPVLVIVILLSWHLVRRYPWNIRLETQVGMLAESLLLAVALVAVGQLHHLLFVNLQTMESEQTLMMVDGRMTHAVSYIGAGVYEEVLFRLLLVPAAFGLFRMMEFPARWAAVMAAISTSFVFALAHHIGPAADAFNLFTFSFRSAAGVFFATVFFLRGFGITVGCHAAYDLLVGVFLANQA
ncbi:MAG: CPBP family glutamic-type intramembrane protease [Fuerstiella sp.]|nr:CPBP family glutamic-type intramembrane protease [Fuerstiella sp.]